MDRSESSLVDALQTEVCKVSHKTDYDISGLVFDQKLTISFSETHPGLKLKSPLTVCCLQIKTKEVNYKDYEIVFAHYGWLLRNFIIQLILPSFLFFTFCYCYVTKS